jgi:hypothetical protein
MFRNISIRILAFTLLAAIGAAALNVVDARAAGASAQDFGGGPGNGGGCSDPAGAGTGNCMGITGIPASDLSADETAALLYMREEEKLARDVYTALAATWNVPAFQNIAASEQQHMDAIGLLLTRYHLADPAQAPGVFTNAKLQNLYTSLVAQGRQSLANAYRVGGAIEEIDILDLQTDLAKADNADIRQVFNNLLNGSYNHLNAFARGYASQTGTAYTAQYLTADALNTILGSSTGSGGQGNGRPAQAGGNGMGGRNR